MSSLQETDAAAAAVAIGPRVSLADIEAKITCRYDITADEALKGCPTPKNMRTLSLCFLVMVNDFMVVGKSAPASPENFNAELGRKFAYEDAIRQLWQLEGYLLRANLSVEPTGEPPSE